MLEGKFYRKKIEIQTSTNKFRNPEQVDEGRILRPVKILKNENRKSRPT